MDHSTRPTFHSQPSDVSDSHSLASRLDHFYAMSETEDVVLSFLHDLEGDAQSPASSSASVELASHLRRVAAYARLLALHAGLSEREAELLRRASPMHDIGKWGIPSAILRKPSKLTPEEFEIMKTHSQMGYDILKHARQEVLRVGALVAIQHQEKFDGSGYPKGLKGEEIHLYSRITTVVDVFDALLSERCYKKAWPVEEVTDYFRQERGRHFDPALVDVLLAHLDEFLTIRDSLTDG